MCPRIRLMCPLGYYIRFIAIAALSITRGVFIVLREGRLQCAIHEFFPFPDWTLTNFYFSIAEFREIYSSFDYYMYYKPKFGWNACVQQLLNKGSLLCAYCTHNVLYTSAVGLKPTANFIYRAVLRVNTDTHTCTRGSLFCAAIWHVRAATRRDMRVISAPRWLLCGRRGRGCAGSSTQCMYMDLYTIRESGLDDAPHV